MMKQPTSTLAQAHPDHPTLANLDLSKSQPSKSTGNWPLRITNPSFLPSGDQPGDEMYVGPAVPRAWNER